MFYVQCYVAVYVSLEIKFQLSCQTRSFGCVFACGSPFTEGREREFSNQHCMINIAYDEIRSFTKHKPFAPSFKNLSIKIFEKRGNMSGYEVYDPSHNDYIEVLNIGEDNSDSEVTIFYRPNKGLHLVQFSTLEYHLATAIFNTRSYTVYFWLHC